MLLGYIFNICEIHQILTGKEEMDDSGEIEKFAEKNQIRFELLNFEECILAIPDDFTNILDICLSSIPGNEISGNENEKRRVGYSICEALSKSQNEALDNLENILKVHNFPVTRRVAIVEPRWSKHGEPLTY